MAQIAWKRKWKRKKNFRLMGNIGVWILMGVRGFYILGSSIRLRPLKKGSFLWKSLLLETDTDIRGAAVKTLYPGLG